MVRCAWLAYQATVCGGMKLAHGRPVLFPMLLLFRLLGRQKKTGGLQNKQEHSNVWEADLLVGCGKMYCRFFFSWLRKGRGKHDLLVALVLFAHDLPVTGFVSNSLETSKEKCHHA